ncbi:MAG TPA: DUF3187 family protein [Steroidobacteraceae bacterium]
MRKWLVGLFLVAFSAPGLAAENQGFYGLLRGRDLSPFGYLRLDMRPGFTTLAEPGSWSVETDLAYQNTWATSPEVEKYLNALPGRRELGPAQLQDIRDLPGENYLVDLELGQVDLTINYQITDRWGAYLIVSGASFGGGFMDGMIESFHELIDNPKFGRPAAARNDYNVLFDLKGSQYAAFEAPGSGGLLDPVVGVRYTRTTDDDRWRVSVESAVKVPLADRQGALSTGKTDVGMQVSLQRFSGKHAVYLNMAAVYYAGMSDLVQEPARVLPTLVAGYERRVTPRTNLIFQGYLSRSVYQRAQTDLSELRGTKIQLSGGFHHRRGPHLFTFALTENIGNINNTPDIGLQMGYSFTPGFNPGWR